MQSPIIIVLKGIIKRITERPRAIRFGTMAYGGIPVGEKLAQVKLPKL